MSLRPCLLSALLLIAAPAWAAQGEVCTCTNESIAWGPIGTATGGTWDGCAADGLDSFLIGTGCIVTINDEGVAQTADPETYIAVASGGTLNVEVDGDGDDAGDAIIIEVGGGGLYCERLGGTACTEPGGLQILDNVGFAVEPGGTLNITGKWRGFGPSDSGQILSRPSALRLGSYIPCQNQDCSNATGVQEIARFQWDPGEWAVHGGADYDEFLAAAAKIDASTGDPDNGGDILVFYDSDTTDSQASTDHLGQYVIRGSKTDFEPAYIEIP
jgi:hypothetical protein